MHTGAAPQGPRQGAAFSRSVLYALGTAVVLRALWALAIPVVPVSDGHAYDVFAQNIASGNGYGWEPHKPSAFWPVGTPAIYALLYWTFGHSYGAVASLQVLVGVLVVVLAASLAGRWFGEASAAPTAWTMACWPLLIEYTTVLASELYFILFVLAAYWLATLPGRSFPLRGAMSGALVAAASYVRPLALLLPPLLFLSEAAAAPQRRRAVLACLLCAATAVVCIAPWTLRNWQVFDRFVVISTNGGSNLWMGNNPDADTGYMRLPKMDVDNEADIDRILGERAKAYIFSEPVTFVRRALKKTLVLHGRETIGITWNEQGISTTLGERVLGPLKAVSSLYWWLVLALAVYGACRLALKLRWTVLVACPPLAAWIYFTIVHSVSVAADRYHMPAIPFIAMLAASAMGQVRLWRRRMADVAPVHPVS